MHSYKYPRPALTVDALVYSKSQKKIQILLVQRGREPFKGKWALPGGFVNMDELLEHACIRELEEETGVKVMGMKQYKVYDALDRDPRHRTISVVYSVELAELQEAKGGDDAAKASWFNMAELPDLAFDHGLILNDFFGRK